MKKDYNHTREVKRVSLGFVKDADIRKHTKDMEFSTYVKKLIREDMKKLLQETTKTIRF